MSLIDRLLDEPDVDALLNEIAIRDSAVVFEEALAALDRAAMRHFRQATSEEDRLYIQAFVNVTEGLRRKLSNKKSKLRKDKPIEAGPGR